MRLARPSVGCVWIASYLLFEVWLRIQASGFGFKNQGFGLADEGSGFRWVWRFWRLGFASHLGFEVWYSVSWFRDKGEGIEIGAWGLGSRVWGLVPYLQRLRSRVEE